MEHFKKDYSQGVDGGRLLLFGVEVIEVSLFCNYIFYPLVHILMRKIILPKVVQLKIGILESSYFKMVLIVLVRDDNGFWS